MGSCQSYAYLSTTVTEEYGMVRFGYSSTEYKNTKTCLNPEQVQDLGFGFQERVLVWLFMLPTCQPTTDRPGPITTRSLKGYQSHSR